MCRDRGGIKGCGIVWVDVGFFFSFFLAGIAFCLELRLVMVLRTGWSLVILVSDGLFKQDFTLLVGIGLKHAFYFL